MMGFMYSTFRDWNAPLICWCKKKDVIAFVKGLSLKLCYQNKSMWLIYTTMNTCRKINLIKYNAMRLLQCFPVSPRTDYYVECEKLSSLKHFTDRVQDQTRTHYIVDERKVFAPNWGHSPRHLGGGACWRSTYRNSYVLNFDSRRSLVHSTSHDQRSREDFDHACWWEE